MIMAAQLVDIKCVKEFARKLPQSSVLRDVILSEPDSLPASEFISKSAVWLKISSKEGVHD